MTFFYCTYMYIDIINKQIYKLVILFLPFFFPFLLLLSCLVNFFFHPLKPIRWGGGCIAHNNPHPHPSTHIHTYYPSTNATSREWSSKLT